MSVDGLHRELGIDYQQLLQQLQSSKPAVACTLAQAHERARRDTTYLPRYRALLERARSLLATTPDIEAKCRDFWAWFEGEYIARDIGAIERRRFPPDYADWSERFLPRSYGALVDGYAKVQREGSGFDELRPIAERFLDAFVAGAE